MRDCLTSLLVSVLVTIGLFANKTDIIRLTAMFEDGGVTTHSITIEVAAGKEHNPKIDHNISLAGLLLTDADTLIHKLEREGKGLLRGLYVFRKRIPSGEVCICNGAEFPNSDAVDLLLYLIVKLEENNWERKLVFKSMRKLLREIYGEESFGKSWIERLKRLLVIWKNHSFYFPGSFLWQGEKVEAYFGVIDDFKIKSQGRGKPSRIEITFNEDFIEICKNTDWYRRPPWLEIKKLRKETAKSLYLLALDFRPNEKIKGWKIYIDNNLKRWYRNALNSLASPKHLRPSIILKRLKGAIEEINEKTNLRMELQKTEEGNYCILVEEVAPAGTEALKIPFDKLSSEDKALLISYVEIVAEEKKIKNIWGFLRSMTSRQLKIWLNRAKKYFEESQKAEKRGKLIEKPKLINTLLRWAKKELKGKPATFKAFFVGRFLTAYENNEKIVFICVDRVICEAMEKYYSSKVKELFKKEVVFLTEEEFYLTYA